jgi:thiol-disulfide isomerase/thioredoxin
VTGPVFLIAALVVAGLVALVLRRRNGRFRDRPAQDVLTSDDLGQPLGERATLLQFSSAFCAPCRATRVLLTDVAGGLDGVAHVEVDAESHLDLVRRLDVMRTPTVMILDARGAVVRRASGQPTRDQVLTALS